MQASAAARRGRAAAVGSSRPAPGVAADQRPTTMKAGLRKHTDHLSDGAKSEPAVTRSLSSRGRERGGPVPQDMEGAAWDWQTRKWVQQNPPPKLSNDPHRMALDATGPHPPSKKSVHGSRHGGWVSDLEGISEREALGEHKKDEFVARIRRDGKVVVRSRRRGYHVVDLQTRRKFTRREHFRRQVNLRRNSIDLASKPFPLLNLEEYLKQKAPLHTEEVGSPPVSDSYLSYMQEKSSMMAHQQRLDLACETPLQQLADVGFKPQNVHPPFALRTYGSADDLDDESDAFHSERSGCGMSWHWPSNRSKNGSSHIDYAGSCFPVSGRRGGRKNTLSYRYASERSVSSFDSDSETVPLMTEPEPFNEYSDDFAASSVELDRDSPCIDQLRRFSRFREDGRKGSTCLKPVEGGVSITRNSRDDADKHRSLSQKYRPKSFKDLVGQGMVAESLSNAILRSKIAPVYLFHGPRGTGKTSASKIFAAAMNCLSIEELRPCGLCKECTSLHKGHNFDVKEVDAAANSEIQSMRQLLKHISLPPSVSRYKVFIIDDCHMLSSEAWNALLKSLEEPPPYVVFILITTDLELLPRTAMSRCQKFMFPRIKESDIVFRLRKLALLEKVEIEVEAMQFIASRSDGSFRDAETMLDQLSLLGKRVTLSLVREMVGLIADDKLAKLLEFALSADTASTVNTIRELIDSGAEPLGLVSQLATLITDLLAGRNRLAGYMTMRVRKEEQEHLRQALRILSEAEKQLRSCTDRATWLTAAFLQLAPNDSGPLGTSSMGTSITQSPVKFFDTSEKETLASRRQSWGGEEKWDSHSPLQLEYASMSSHQGIDGEGVRKQMDSQNLHFSGPFTDNRIYPCDQSPQSISNYGEGRKSVLSGSPSMRRVVKRDTSTMSPSTMDNIWKEVVQGSRSSVLKQLLHGEGKLVSLSVTEAFAIAHLEFRSVEHKGMAERSKVNIINAFQLALGCPVELEMTVFTSHGDKSFSRRVESPNMPRAAEHVTRPSLVESVVSQEHRRNRSSSFRKSSSSFRNVSTVSSPQYRSMEQRHSKQSFDLEGSGYSKRITNTDRPKTNEGSGRTHPKQVMDGSHPDMQRRPLRSAGRSSDRTMMLMPDGNVCTEEEVHMDGPRPSLSAHGNEHEHEHDHDHGNNNDDDNKDNDVECNSSDSEAHDGSAPSLLCWKGARMSNHKGKLRRRRRTRFLLRLVPCAKEGGGHS